MDTYLKRHLIGEGHLSETGLTHRPRLRHCQRGCGLVLLAAINDYGLDTWLDPYPVTIAAELAALLDGRATYTQCENELVLRDAWRISRRNADREPAWVEHRCGSPPFEINYRHVKTKTRTDYSQPPPF
jgi:hypothetical protein